MYKKIIGLTLIISPFLVILILLLALPVGEVPNYQEVNTKQTEKIYIVTEYGEEITRLSEHNLKNIEKGREKKYKLVQGDEIIRELDVRDFLFLSDFDISKSDKIQEEPFKIIDKHHRVIKEFDVDVIELLEVELEKQKPYQLLNPDGEVIKRLDSEDLLAGWGIEEMLLNKKTKD